MFNKSSFYKDINGHSSGETKLYSSLDIVKKHSVLDNNNTVFGD